MSRTLSSAGFRTGALVAAATVCGVVAAADSVAEFLARQEIDRPARAALEQADAWTEEAEAVLVKVLARLDPPRPAVASWREAARPMPAGADGVTVGDELLRIRGRATFVAPWPLSERLATIAGKPAYDVVRIADEGGLKVDVVMPRAPLAWPRWRPIDEPVEALVLPLSTRLSARPGSPPAEAAAWPAEAPAVLTATSGLTWAPDTAAGRAGANPALFDTVVDGKPLEAGDTDAFYSLLAAAGRVSPAALAAEAGTTDVMQLVDPRSGWFPGRRGEPVVIEGTALKATRIAVDDESRRLEAGLDHYWELVVFVPTPLLEVDGKLQESYPIVCCVRSLPPGLDSRAGINERVRVAGFALKRYAYAFEKSGGQGGREQGRRITTLVIGPAATLLPAAAAGDGLVWLIAGVAALVAMAATFFLGALSGSRSINRAIRKSRAELPDRVELPEEPG